MRDYKAEYHFYKGLGICVRCHKLKAEPNRVCCYECIDRDKIRDREKYIKHADKINKRDKERYKALKEQGICTYCKHEKAVPGKTKCQKCLNKLQRKRILKQNGIPRSERPSYEMCYLCGKAELFEDKKVCAACYEKRYQSISKIMYMPVSKEWRNDNKAVYK